MEGATSLLGWNIPLGGKQHLLGKLQRKVSFHVIATGVDRNAMSRTEKDKPSFVKKVQKGKPKPQGKGGHKNLVREALLEVEEDPREEAKEDA